MEEYKHTIDCTGTLRKQLNADAMFANIYQCFEQVDETSKGTPDISLADNLMSGFAVFSLKDSSLLAFDRRRIAEEANLKAIYGMHNIPCDTQMRTRLDEVNPDSLRLPFSSVFGVLQRGRLLEQMLFMENCYLVSIDGTGYFSSEKLSSPYCLEKKHSATGKTFFQLQALGAAIVHPDRKEVIPLPPEPICKKDGDTKNDCERNACKRWLDKFRKDHPHLKVIVTEDGLSSNAPHIRDLKEHKCHFILGLKEGDHAYLSEYIATALIEGKVTEHTVVDSNNSEVRHTFRFLNGVPINKSNQDLLVNVLEYWEITNTKQTHFCWVTDFTITRNNAFQIMRGGRARWKIENETFNTLKNQGYHFEHNYGLGKKYLSMVFVNLMMLAFLVDQALQLSCPLFQAALKKSGCKRELWENIRSVFRFFFVDSMEMIYRIILSGPQKIVSTPNTS